jgi:hypothetical protein
MQNGLTGSIGVGLLAALAGACDAQVDPEYTGEPLLTLKGRVEALQQSPGEADIGVLWFESDARRGCSGPVRNEFTFTTGTFSADQQPDFQCAEACGEFPAPGDDREHDVDALRQQIGDWESCQRACGLDVTAELTVAYQACVTGAVGQTAPVVGDFPAQFSLDMLLPPPARALMPSDTGERVALGYFVALAPHSGALEVSFEREPPAWLMGGSETHVLAYAADPIAAASSWGLYLGGAFDVGYHLLRVQFGTRCGLPELELDEADSEGFDAPDSADLMPMPDTYPLGESGSLPVPESDEASLPLPDYRDVPFVCGNGICEAGEDCRHCSDCGGCDSGAAGQSTGILYGGGGYSCLSTANLLVEAAPGGEAEIQLSIAPPERIAWPSL